MHRIGKYMVSVILMMAVAGMQGQKRDKLYFVILNINQDLPFMSKQEMENLQQVHIANINMMYNDGLLMTAGAFDEGGGIFILKASSIMDAQAILMADPAIKAERYKTEIHPMHFALGGLCNVVDAADMAEYHFYLIRYLDQPSPEQFASRDSLLIDLSARMSRSTLINPLVVITFEQGLEGVLIMKGKSRSAAYSALDLDEMNEWDLDYRLLLIARQSFCDSNP